MYYLRPKFKNIYNFLKLSVDQEKFFNGKAVDLFKVGDYNKCQI